jgi:phosphatidate cytidylyltransferase
MLLMRALSAIVLAPIAIVVILLGGWALAGMLIVVLTVAGLEYVRLMQRGGYRPAWWMVVALIVVLSIDPILSQSTLAPIALSLALLVTLAWQLTQRSPSAAADWALTLAGGVYLGWAGRHFVLIREFPNGAMWLILVVTGAWFADSGAYLVGVRWGRHKLAPLLSPKKSWEGLLGGAVFSIAGNALLALAFALPPIHGAMLGLSGATLGAIGDLAISMMKRQVGAKDSGRLIPGHGGALDRIDSLLFTVLAGYLYLVWFVQRAPG